MKTLRFRSNGFTLVELLAVIAIIAILASLLFSSVTVVRAKARQSTCINNQYQLAKALIQYATDSEKFPTTLGALDDKYLPQLATDPSGSSPGSAYAAFTADYYGNVIGLKQCPEVRANQNGVMPSSYGLNLYVTNQNLSTMTDPSQTVLTADSNVTYIETSEQGSKRHFSGCVASFADGHVEWIKDFGPHVSMTTDLTDAEGGSETPPPPPEGGGTPPPEPYVPPATFGLDNGQVTLNYDASAHVAILAAQYAESSSNWYDLYVDILVTLPGGETLLYNMLDPNGFGVNGGMNPNQLAGYAWDSPTFDHNSTIDIYGTAKSWTKVKQKVNGKTQWVWIPHTQSAYNTANSFGSQVWVLKNGDVVPTVPGLWNQMSVGQSVEAYTQVGADGVKRMNLSENQVIYFFEMGQTNPYLSNGQHNPGYDMNDLVVLVDLNKGNTVYNDDKTHGNNGVGNGEDPQPPGNPPINDGPGTCPGNPGNKGGAHL